jgi:heptosyltransferase-2/heptosyltransferase-3
LRRYDVAIIARDDHWWGALLAALAGIPRRIGYNLPETAPFLTNALPHTFAAHVTTQSLDLVTMLTQQQYNQLPALRAPIDAADRAWAAEWLAQHHVAATQPLVAIHPGSGGSAKLWLHQRWIEVAAALQQRDVQIVLTGGAGERELVEAIGKKLPQAPLLMVGEASIPQLTALYSYCGLVLGVDSGPLHLAVAAGVPTIALFGPGDDQRFGPWGSSRNKVLRSDLWCSPCGVLDSCPRGTAPSECMTLIPTDQVLTAIDIVLTIDA